MRVLVTGSRNYPGGWVDIGVHLPESHEDAVIIHGACSRKVDGVEVSVDMLADFAAHGLGHRVLAFPVDHATDGEWPEAGPRRNARMIRDGKPDRGLAFGALWTNTGGYTRTTPKGKRQWKKTGTGGCVALMLAAELPVRWVPAPGADAVDLHEMPWPPVEG